MPDDRAKDPILVPKENASILYWLFTTMAMGMGGASVILYFLVRNQSLA